MAITLPRGGSSGASNLTLANGRVIGAPADGFSLASRFLTEAMPASPASISAIRSAGGGVVPLAAASSARSTTVSEWASARTPSLRPLPCSNIKRRMRSFLLNRGSGSQKQGLEVREFEEITGAALQSSDARNENDCPVRDLECGPSPLLDEQHSLAGICEPSDLLAEHLVGQDRREGGGGRIEGEGPRIE